MNYTTLQEAVKQAGLTQEIDALSVYRAFEQVQDRRHRRGVRYRVALILTLIVLGKLSGMTTLAGIAQGDACERNGAGRCCQGHASAFPAQPPTAMCYEQ
jgi:hypothetical protein